MQQVVIIVGPTSSGKSALAVALARKFGGEVVSVDSRQVYKGLDIGTGKVSKREMRGVPHHLLDVASPKRTMTAHAYAQRAQRALQDILRRGKLPILAGGTGFYADVVAGRILLPSVPANRSLRAKLEKKSASALFAMLKKRNARRARAIDPHNKRRLVRALEIAEGSTGVGSLYTENRPLYDFLWLGIDMPKEELEKKIYTRLRARLKRGLVAEAVRLRRSGLSHKRMEALGLEYRWLALLLQKRVSKTAFEDGLARDICRYARRQRTYWRRNTDIEWFDPRDARAIEARVRQFLC